MGDPLDGWLSDDREIEARDVRKNYPKFESDDFLEQGIDQWGDDEHLLRNSSDKDYYFGSKKIVDEDEEPEDRLTWEEPIDDYGRNFYGKIIKGE